ncbi:Myrcene synthase chloroplastic [Euphorbia peplus]|nr:Myrcene synthase chloroplastic [Euphorbia peplus]WCJ37096.1 Myrcene synthase chloroplastic [Euphorbia peplus]
MALNLTSSSLCGVTVYNLENRLMRIPRMNTTVSSGIRAANNIVTAKVSVNEPIVRRTANYQPSNWDFDFVSSLSSKFMGEEYTAKQKELKAEVKMMLEKERNHLNKLEMIATLQRLGVAYHFEDEIDEFLRRIYCENILNKNTKEDDIYTTALQFRLLRQEGYNVSPDVFNRFKDEQGNFKAWLCEDIKGLIYMYEASFLSIGGEIILEELKEFALKNLQKYAENKLRNSSDGEYISKIVNHALEFPLHWRIQRAEAKWFMTVYEISPFLNPIFLQLAKLDFNVVQATYQDDLKHATGWWKKTELGKKLDFVRDRPTECFLWTVGGFSEPEFGYERRMLSRVGALINVIDDTYDVYATLEEARLFTEAVERWDVNAMDQLPDYMKICFLALHNTVNEMGFDCLKEQGVDVIPFFKKAWTDLCKSFLLEAEWYYSGYKPSLKEYLQNGWISFSGPLLLVHAYFASTNQITNEATESFKGSYPEIVQFSSLITRLADDLATSSHEMERGDTPKSIQCYMHEAGVSEEAAREHIHHLIGEAWEKMNKNNIENTTFSKKFMRMAMNLVRMSLCFYQFGDGFGAQNMETKKNIISLLVQPLQL